MEWYNRKIPSQFKLKDGSLESVSFEFFEDMRGLAEAHTDARTEKYRDPRKKKWRLRFIKEVLGEEIPEPPLVGYTVVDNSGQEFLVEYGDTLSRRVRFEKEINAYLLKKCLEELPQNKRRSYRVEFRN